MKIGKIKKLKSGKYKIEIDDHELTTYSDVILNNDILYKKDIDVATINKLNTDTKYYDSYNKIVKYILNRLRSEKEICDYMNKLEILETDQEKILTDLKRSNLLNDEVFTSSYINDHIYLSKEGPNKIYDDLIKHNIDSNIISKYLNKIPEEDLYNKINKYIAKKANKTSTKLFKQKMMSELLLLGFNQEMISNCLQKSCNDDTEVFEKEYNKLYKKLSKKHSGQELKYKIKEKLYQKGFDVNKIKE